MIDNVFKNKIPVIEKLLAWGFILENNVYIYTCKIVDNQFNLIVKAYSNGEISTQIIDPDTGDEYILHLTENAEGRFVGRVRSEYLSILQTIADKCFDTKVFQSEYADKIIHYIREKYHNDFEYLWEKFPENAIVRRTDNQKWYAAILTAAKNKIGLPGKEKIEIIDLRMQTEQIEHLVDGKKYFPGYHMNKKHWITLCLDGSVDIKEIYRLIDESYLLAKK